MSQPFLTRFLAGQRAKGQDQTPLFDMLTGLQAKTADDVLVSPQPTGCARLVERRPASSRPKAHSPKAPPVKPQSYQQGAPSAVRLVVSGEAAVQSLTACLDAAPCRQSARLIFRALYAVALDVARAQGHAANVSRSVFHLPAELLMNHVGLRKSAFYDNLQYLLNWAWWPAKRTWATCAARVWLLGRCGWQPDAGAGAEQASRPGTDSAR